MSQTIVRRCVVDEAIKQILISYEVWLTTIDSTVYSDDQKSRFDAMISEIAAKIFKDFLSVSVDRRMKWIKVELKNETIVFAAGTVNRLNRLSQNHDQNHP